MKTTLVPSGHRQSSSGSRLRATPEAGCYHRVSGSCFFNILLPSPSAQPLKITRPKSAFRFPSRSSHLDSLSPSPPEMGSIHCGPQLLLTSLTAQPRLSRLRLRTLTRGSLSQEPPGRPVSCCAPLPRPCACTSVPLAAAGGSQLLARVCGRAPECVAASVRGVPRGEL